MIFYFTATGNSLYVAQKLHESEGGRFIDIADAIKEGNFRYTLSDDEKIGFIFPVYFYGIPTIISEFINQLVIESSGEPFIYAILTCGAKIGMADEMFDKLLQQKDFQLKSTHSIDMPDNYVLLYDIPSNEKQKILLTNAEQQISRIIKDIQENKKGNFCSHHGKFARFMTRLLYPFYEKGRKTRKFYATEACNGCGLCEKICPSKVIRVSYQSTEWVEAKCAHCLACIHRCPMKAIQYGKSTIKRGRYVNPNAKFNFAKDRLKDSIIVESKDNTVITKNDYE